MGDPGWVLLMDIMDPPDGPRYGHHRWTAPDGGRGGHWRDTAGPLTGLPNGTDPAADTRTTCTRCPEGLPGCSTSSWVARWLTAALVSRLTTSTVPGRAR
jgi:hypothetical protein